MINAAVGIVKPRKLQTTSVQDALLEDILSNALLNGNLSNK